MDFEKFIEKIKRASVNNVDDDDIAIIRRSTTISDEGMKRLERNIKASWIKSKVGHVPEFIELSNLESRLQQGSIGLWLYDRKTQVCIIHLKPGRHEVLAGALYNAYSGKWELEDGAELYLKECMGCYVSGAMGMYIPMKDKAFKFDENEAVLDRAKGKLEWRGIPY